MTTDSKMHPLQKFEARTIHRSLIKEAPYNPSVAQGDSQKKLDHNLENKGLLDTLVWNEDTGNLVSGHKRLSKLDRYAMKTLKSLDYEITVAVVHLTLKEEVEQNLFFNNQKAQGIFDDNKMLDIFKGTNLPQIDFKEAGFDDEDLAIFGIENDLVNNPIGNIDELDKEFAQIKEARKESISPEEQEQRTQAVKNVKKQVTKNEVDTYVTLTFSSQDAKQDFMRKIGQPVGLLFIKGEAFVEKYFAQ